MWVSHSLVQEHFNLYQALHYGSFSHRVLPVPSVLQSMDLRIIWPNKGPHFCRSDPWILVPEEPGPILHFPAEAQTLFGQCLDCAVRCMPCVLLHFEQVVSHFCPGANFTILCSSVGKFTCSGGRWDLCQAHLSGSSTWHSLRACGIHTDAP